VDKKKLTLVSSNVHSIAHHREEKKRTPEERDITVIIDMLDELVHRVANLEKGRAFLIQEVANLRRQVDGDLPPQPRRYRMNK